MAIVTTAKVILVVTNLLFPQDGGFQVNSEVIQVGSMKECTLVADNINSKLEAKKRMIAAHCQYLEKFDD